MFDNVYKLRKHITTVHRKAKSVCKECGVEVKNLKQHMGSVHASKDIALKCDKCEYVTHSKKYYDAHMERHNGTLNHKFMCDKCGKKFKYLYLQKQHLCGGSQGSQDMKLNNELKTGVHMSQKSNKCSICNIDFATAAGYFKHYKVTHERLPPEYSETELLVCDECGNTFVTKDGLKMHVEKIHQNTVKPVPQIISCDKCDKTFKNKRAFVVHHKVTHGSVPSGFDDCQVYQCHQCPKAFYLNSKLSEHINMAHLKQKFNCSQCDMSFARKVTLSIHIKSKHTNFKPFKCVEKGCENRTFPTNGRLQTHIINTHQRVTCEHCGKEICNAFILSRHMYSVHGIKPKDSISCQYCDSFFKNESALKKHVVKQHS